MNTKKSLITLIILSLMIILQSTALLEVDASKPIIVCTTSAVGSVIQDYVGDDADIVVLVQPGLCPADFDMKPSDVYAVKNAKILFKQDIPGEFWLQGLLDSAGNTNLIQVSIPGAYNTPQGAKNYIQWIGGNLSSILDTDLSAKMSSMLNEVDSFLGWMTSRSQELNVSSVKVVCMNWLATFIEAVGFQVVASYNPPETLSASDITNLVDTARSEGATLIVDNLQIDTEFGLGIASQVGAEHVVLTNFPGALPETDSLAKMFQYNAEQLFNAVNTWKTAASLKAEQEDLKNQIFIYQIVSSIAVVAAAVEAVYLYIGRKKR